MRMRKKKWARPELAACEYFIDEPETLKGKWNKSFEKTQPVYLELGCGKSPFLAKMGLLHEDINFIGIDSKTAGIFVFQAWQISFKQKRRADLCCTAIILTIQNTVVFYYLIYYYNFIY